MPSVTPILEHSTAAQNVIRATLRDDLCDHIRAATQGDTHSSPVVGDLGTDDVEGVITQCQS